MVDKYFDSATGKEIFRIKDDGTEEATDEGTLHFLLKDVEYWEAQMEEHPTSRTKEALDWAKQRLKDFREGKKKWD